MSTAVVERARVASADGEAVVPSRAATNWAALRALVWRDLVRFFRQRSRVAGALLQPLLFWLILGSGLDRSFVSADGAGYSRYFFPGVVLMIVLFTAIFSTMSVIEDRHRGLLQAVLVAPVDRSILVLGKTLGGVAIAMAQAVAFVALAPLAGYGYTAMAVVPLLAALLLVSIALSAFGFLIAWWVDSTQGYHVVMSVLLLPMWVLSGAMFPAARAAPWVGYLMAVNPLHFAMDAVRAALTGSWSGTSLLASAGFALVAVVAAAQLVARRPHAVRG